MTTSSFTAYLGDHDLRVTESTQISRKVSRFIKVYIFTKKVIALCFKLMFYIFLSIQIMLVLMILILIGILR